MTDLLQARVVDSSGRTLGVVTDIRLVQDGPILGDFGAAFRVHGLVVGPRRLGAHLGFDRANVRGPWLVKRIFLLLQRRSKYAAWGLVRSVEEGTVRIDLPSEGLPPAGPAR